MFETIQGGMFEVISNRKHDENNCLRFANPAEALGGRHLEAWSLTGMETWKLGGSDMLILGSSCIFLLAF